MLQTTIVIFFLQTPTNRRDINLTPRSQTAFHTPIGHRLNGQRTETFASALDTTKSTIKTSKSDEHQTNEATERMATVSGDNGRIDDDKEKVIEVLEHPKIKFVQCADTQPTYHTPISFKMNKFIMCFKSEPDLSRVQSVNDNVPMLNRGRFIAKKLLSGVSMINLRRPFGSNNEKATIKVEKPTAAAAIVDTPIANDMKLSSTCEQMNCATSTAPERAEVCILNDKIDDDDEDFVDDEEVDREYDDSVDKENQSPVEPCNTTEFISKLKPLTTIGCSIPLSDSISNDSVSPITISTHRMSKAMQVNEPHNFKCSCYLTSVCFH